MKNIKLVTYAGPLMFENNFRNMSELKKYVKNCGGFKAIGDYEIYTQDNEYRYNNTLKIWVKL